MLSSWHGRAAGKAARRRVCRCRVCKISGSCIHATDCSHCLHSFSPSCPLTSRNEEEEGWGIVFSPLSSLFSSLLYVPELWEAAVAGRKCRHATAQLPAPGLSACHR